jgi:hypothetical protein
MSEAQILINDGEIVLGPRSPLLLQPLSQPLSQPLLPPLFQSPAQHMQQVQQFQQEGQGNIHVGERRGDIPSERKVEQTDVKYEEKQVPQVQQVQQAQAQQAQQVQRELNWVMFRTKSGRGWWICPESGERSQPLEQGVIHPHFNGPIWWNESRLCYVLPSRPGLNIWNQYHPHTQAKQEECGNLDFFPRHQEFKVRPSCPHALQVPEPYAQQYAQQHAQHQQLHREEIERLKTQLQQLHKVQEENKHLTQRLHQLQGVWQTMQQHFQPLGL